MSSACSSYQKGAEAICLIQEAKRVEHADTYLSHTFEFTPFSFSLSFDSALKEILTGLLLMRLLCAFLDVGGPLVSLPSTLFCSHGRCSCSLGSVCLNG